MTTEADPAGRLAVHVSDATDRVSLRRCGELLVELFSAQAVERFDGGDQIFWDFVVTGIPVTLHWREAVGIALVAGDSSARTAEFVKLAATRLSLRGPQ